MENPITLYGASGSGSVAVEAALTLIGLPYKLVDAVTWETEAARAKVALVNPMKQVPVLVTPSGQVMTESAAILIWLADTYSSTRLAPWPADARRAEYLRWMVYVSSAIYSLYWIRDVPSRLAANSPAEMVIKSRTAERIAECWRFMDRQVQPGEYLLGDTISLLDVYVAVVSRWTPRRRRFYQEAPRMAEVVRRVDAEPRLQALWSERFPFSGDWDGCRAVAS